MRIPDSASARRDATVFTVGQTMKRFLLLFSLPLALGIMSGCFGPKAGEGGGGGQQHPAPLATTLVPSRAVINTGPFTLMIDGTFNASDSFLVAFGADTNLVPSQVTPTVITVTIPNSDLQQATTVGVQVQDTTIGKSSSNLKFIIEPAQLALSPATVPGGQVGTPYPSQTITVSGGTLGTTGYNITVIGLPANGFSYTTATDPLGFTTMVIVSGTPAAAQNTTFTISVTDSGSPAQTAKTSYTITVEAANLTLTPSVLSNATVGAEYNQAVNAAGGTEPYTFTVVGLPADNLTAATGAASVAIAGAPQSLQSSLTVSVSVTDSSNPPQTAKATYSIAVNAASACVLAGQYAFLLGGPTPVSGGYEAGSVTVANDGSISGGVLDFKSPSQGELLLDQAISSGGTCTNGSVANTGTLNFTAGGINHVIAFAVNSDDTIGNGFEEDAAVNNGLVSGQIELQDDPTSIFQGSYGFGLVGMDSSENPYAIIGAFCTNAQQGITYMQADLDYNFNNTPMVGLSNAVTFSAPDSNGRSVVKQMDFSNGAIANLVLYVIDGAKAFAVESSPSSTSPQAFMGSITGVAGSTCLPSTGSFSNSSLSNSVFSLAGIVSEQGVVQLGVVNNVNPAAGTASYTEDFLSIAATTVSNASLNYAISTAGRAVFTVESAGGTAGQVNAYLDGTGAAYLLGIADGVEVGMSEVQAAGPLGATSMGGTYDLVPPLNEAFYFYQPGISEVAINNTAFTFSASGTNGSSSTSPYSVDPTTGRGTATLNNNTTFSSTAIVFYIVSPGKIVVGSGVGSGGRGVVTLIQ
jgi:hypothetical protein